MTTPNTYETHITLAAADDMELRLLQIWTETRNLKWTHIVLDCGECPSQPMVTFWGTSSINDQKARSGRLVIELKQLGAEIVRVKTEASIENDEVPTVAEEINPSPDQYFEHHIKLLLTKETALNRLRTLVTSHAAQLSRNARRSQDDKFEERFITQRLYGTIKDVAHQSLQILIADLQQHEYEILEIEEEYVVFDSNHDLDRGWIATEFKD